MRSVVRHSGRVAGATLLALLLSCERDPSSVGSKARTKPTTMNPSEYYNYKVLVETVQQYAGSPVTRLSSGEDLLGSWEMRFAGPVGSDDVQWRYEFGRGGKVKVGDETWRWELLEEGTLSLTVPVAPDPLIPEMEQGAESEERRHAFKTKDGRIVLSNEDTSVVEILSREDALQR